MYFDTWHLITTCFPTGMLKKSLGKKNGLKLNANKLNIQNIKLSQPQTLSFTQTKYISHRHGVAFLFLKCRLYVTRVSLLSHSVFIQTLQAPVSRKGDNMRVGILILVTLL